MQKVDGSMGVGGAVGLAKEFLGGGMVVRAPSRADTKTL